jgi:hypothetical protein
VQHSRRVHLQQLVIQAHRWSVRRLTLHRPTGTVWGRLRRHRLRGQVILSERRHQTFASSLCQSGVFTHDEERPSLFRDGHGSTVLLQHCMGRHFWIRNR